MSQQHGEPMDPGKTGTASGAYPQVEAVDAVGKVGGLDNVWLPVAAANRRLTRPTGSSTLGRVRLKHPRSSNAIAVMRDMKNGDHQLFRGFSLSGFDGTTVLA